MEEIGLKIKKLMPGAKLPVYGSEFAAGADLFALCEHAVRIGPNETAIVHTGLAAEIPAGYVGLIYARSGLASKKGLAPANKVGVIDSDYRGEIRVALHNPRVFSKKHKYHCVPVEPKPPAPRAVSESSSASSKRAVT